MSLRAISRLASNMNLTNTSNVAGVIIKRPESTVSSSSINFRRNFSSWSQLIAVRLSSLANLIFSHTSSYDNGKRLSNSSGDKDQKHSKDNLYRNRASSSLSQKFQQKNGNCFSNNNISRQLSPIICNFNSLYQNQNMIQLQNTQGHQISNSRLSGLSLNQNLQLQGLQYQQVRSFSTRKLHGRMFWRRRPHFTPMRHWNKRSRWLEGRPFMKGVCINVMIRNPRKPNSGNRKCARVRLTNKRRVTTYIPGMGHNLQVHSVVLVRGGRTPDVIGCNYKLIRGKYDLLPVKNRSRSRSKYGIKRPVPEAPKYQGERLRNIETTEMRRKYFYRTGKELGEDESIPYIPVQRKYPPFPVRTTWGRKQNA